LKPETAEFLSKSRELLERAPALLAHGFAEEAGRAAYLAGFHAAQAFIFEKAGRSPRTLSGVHSEFARLSKLETSIDAALRTFLGRAFNLKTIADYGTGPASKINYDRAAGAIEAAQRFLAAIEGFLKE